MRHEGVASVDLASWGRVMRIRTISGIGIALCVAAVAVAQESRPAQTPSEQPSVAHAQTSEGAEPSVTVLGSRQAQSILGKDVRSSADENMGRIVDVIVDRSGRVRAAVIDFGGFLGVGSRKIAVDWNALSFPSPTSERDVVTLELTRDQVREAPEYKDKRTVIVLGAAGALQPLPNE